MKYQHPQTIPDERRWRLPASPITRASEDELNHIEHARELRKLLIEVSQAGSAATSEERKNTIALLGDFGAGKSGIYYLLKSQTKADDAFDIVRLAAWKHDAGDLRLSMLRKVHWHLYCQQHQLSEESLSPDDIKTISKEFDDLFYSKTSRQAIELALPASADDIRSETNRRVIMEFGIAGIGALFVAFFSFVILEALGANGGLKLSIPAVAILAVGFPLRQFIARHFHHLSELSKPPTITEVRDLPRTSEQLEAIFGHFVRQWKRTSERLPVFFVDDVDRQPAARLLQVLDAVRTFTEVGDCVFVVACDETRVKSALEATRRDLKADFNSGPTQFDDYIQRYFPHCHRLPPYEAKDMVGFVERAIGKVENEHVLSYLQNEHAFPLREVLEVLIHDGIQTPRQAFGIVDAYCGKLAVAARLERTQRLNPGTVTSNPWFLARVVVIENHFPERLHELRLFPELLRWVGMRERGTVSSLEDHELAATRAWYAEMGDEETDRPPKYPELVRFVSRHHRYSAPSALPFIYLNEYGEQGAFGDAIRQELRQSLAAGQVAQLRSRLESANSPEVRRLICGVVSEFLEREELDQSGIRNALEVVPEIFDLLDGSLAHRVADDWASRVKNLSAEEQLLEVDPQKALDVLAYLPPHSAMLPELGAIVVGRGEPEPAAETDARTRLKTGLRNPEILFRAGESLTEPIKQYLSTPVESEGELAAVADYCSFVVAEPEDSLRVLELFGRPFTHRLISAIAQPAKETTEEAPAEELVSEEGAISDGLLTDTIQRLWPTMSSEDHRKTIHELCGDVRTLPVATCLLRKNWSGESELESQTFDVLTAASSADGGLVLDVAKIAVLILGDREDTRSDRTCKAADSIGERLVQSDVSWGDCIRVVDDLAEAIGPLPQSHNAIAEATVEELASDAMNEDVAESVVPYLLNHSRRLSAATQKRVVHSIMAPIEKDIAEEDQRF